MTHLYTERNWSLYTYLRTMRFVNDGELRGENNWLLPCFKIWVAYHVVHHYKVCDLRAGQSEVGTHFSVSWLGSWLITTLLLLILRMKTTTFNDNNLPTKVSLDLVIERLQILVDLLKFLFLGLRFQLKV